MTTRIATTTMPQLNTKKPSPLTLCSPFPRWSWLHAHEGERLRSKAVLEFLEGGVLKNPWSRGTWGEITVMPEVVGVDFDCPSHMPMLSLSFGNAVHVACMNTAEKSLKSIRIPDGALNIGGVVPA